MIWEVLKVLGFIVQRSLALAIPLFAMGAAVDLTYLGLELEWPYAVGIPLLGVLFVGSLIGFFYALISTFEAIRAKFPLF